MTYQIRTPVADTASVPVEPLGDSTTIGTGNSGLGCRPYLLRSLRPPYRVDFVGPYKSVYPNTTEVDQDHSGLSSDTLSNMNSRVVADIAAYHPRIILLMGGINDMALGASAATTLTRLATILTTIHTTDPTIVTVCAQIPCDSAHALYANAQTFNAGVPGVVTTRQAAGQHVTYVDNFTGVTCGAADVHPTDAGYQTVAARWYAGLLAYAPALAVLGDPQ